MNGMRSTSTSDAVVIRARRCLQLDVYQTEIPRPTQTIPVGNFSPPFCLLSTSFQPRLQPVSTYPLNNFPSLLLLGHLVCSPDQHLCCPLITHYRSTQVRPTLYPSP